MTLPHKLAFRAATQLIRLTSKAIETPGKSGNRICILNYHRILESSDPLLDSDPDLHTFHWQMALLAECFNVMPLSEALHALETRALPPRAVCITFDDGYRSIHDLALPILKKYNMPATVFVTSGYIDAGSMWNDKILEAMKQISGDQINLADISLGTFPIKTIKNKKQSIYKLTEIAKYLPSHKRSALTHKLEELAGAGNSSDIMLTREMISALAQQGIEIGAHTVSHPILTRLDDDSARHEIEAGKKQLEEITGRPVQFFAYPNGKAGLDFDDRHVALAKEAGFTAAFTTTFGAATKDVDRFRIPRSRPWDATPLFFGLRLLRWLKQ
jgi:peptidoglycan/xylan/chitin deacetylase (PgdA/CDA1 family)